VATPAAACGGGSSPSLEAGAAGGNFAGPPETVDPGGPGPAPRLGEHGRAVLSEAGFDAARIDALIASGAMRVA
jgi:crotonobetainyl-CoA:carnitine CoA-transferase CaiB-like acyl-CoA transferase